MKEMQFGEAIEFFIAHAEWLKEKWSLTPEGREYQEKFLAAIEAVK
jgi:hypothetical protein